MADPGRHYRKLQIGCQGTFGLSYERFDYVDEVIQDIWIQILQDVFILKYLK